MRVLFGSFFLFSNFYQLYLQNKFVLHLQIYDEASAKIKLIIGPPLI